MTKNDIITKISEETGIIKEDVYAVVQKTLDAITDALVRGEKVEIRDFGVFEVRNRRARTGRNPLHPEKTFEVPARKGVKFKPGKKMKESVINS